jgi:hypothetical protein
VNGPAFDSTGIPEFHKTGYHALIFNAKSLFESARLQQHGKSDRTTDWAAQSAGVALDLQQPPQAIPTICVTSLLGYR